MSKWLRLLCCVLMAAALGACSATGDDVAPAAEVTPEAEALGEAGTPTEAAEASAEDVYDITEKMFIALASDVYMNEEEFLGKNIRLEGMFFSNYYEPTDSEYHMVIRYGCCGADDSVGFEVYMEDASGIATPAQNDWVEAVGVLERYEELGSTFLRLNLTSLKVMETRGAETVLQ